MEKKLTVPVNFPVELFRQMNINLRLCYDPNMQQSVMERISNWYCEFSIQGQLVTGRRIANTDIPELMSYLGSKCDSIHSENDEDRVVLIYVFEEYLPF